MKAVLAHRLQRSRGIVWPACLLAGLLATLAACSESSHAQDPGLANGFTSAREEAAARNDASYAHRLRLADRLARSVKTDSLRKLYLAALDAPKSRLDTVWMAIGCEYLRHMEQVGAPAAKRADLHLRDSLKTSPDFSTRWSAMQTRMPTTGALGACDSPGAPVPDSLESLPFPNALR